MRALGQRLVAAAATAGIVFGLVGAASADTINVSPASVTLAPGASSSFVVYLVANDDATDLVDGCNAMDSNQQDVTIRFTSTDTDVVPAPSNVDLAGCDDPDQAGIQNGATVNFSVAAGAEDGASTTITATVLNGQQGVRLGTPPTSGTFTSDTLIVNVEAADACASVAVPAAPTFVGVPDGANGWYTSVPTVSATSTGATVAYSTSSGGPYGTAPTLSDGQTTVYAVATGPAPCSKQSTESSQLFKVDTQDPAVTLVGGPADGGSYYFGSVPAAPTCTALDPAPGSGLTGTCAVTGYSALVGNHTVTGTQADVAGNTGMTNASFTVLAWTAGGFYQPVDMNKQNLVKGGATVPLKFEVFAGTTELTSTAVVTSFRAVKTNCDTSAYLGTDEIEDYTSGSTSLRYDTTGGQFVQNWQVPKGANVCYAVTLTLADGTPLSANFKTK